MINEQWLITNDKSFLDQRPTLREMCVLGRSWGVSNSRRGEMVERNGGKTLRGNDEGGSLPPTFEDAKTSTSAGAMGFREQIEV